MASVRELTIQAAVASLEDPTGKPSGLTVHRSRFRPIDLDNLPAIVVYPVLEEPELANIMPGDMDRDLQLRLECRVEADPPDPALDPLYLWAVARMTADGALGGAVKQVTEGNTAWPTKTTTATDLGACATDFIIEFETVANDPETAK